MSTLRHPFIPAVLLLTSLGLHGQVISDSPIQLEGVNTADRAIQGLRDAAAPGDALNAGTLQAGTYLYAEVDGPAAWQADPQPPVADAGTGLCLLLRSAQANTGPVTVSVNGGAPIPVLKQGGQPLAAGDVGAGETVAVVHDGTAFQLISSRRMDRKPCPSSTVQVNELYCIEPVERDSVEFPDASVTCGNLGMQMCTWGQWYYACTNATTLGMQGMVGNWEWTNSSTNSATQVRVVGQTSCTHAASTFGWGDGYARTYRCCFRR